MADLRERIYTVLREPFLAGCATVTEDGKPWVRYVMPKADEDLTIRFSTFVNSRKVGQIEKHPDVHLVCGVTDPMNWKHYIQIQGAASLTTDQAEKDAFWTDMLGEIFSGPDNPQYGVVIIKPSRIEFYTKGNVEMEIWEAG